MAINTQYGNYIKFLRGTPALWATIQEADKNPDTLFFISDPGAATGKLYLGPKLISNGDITSATSIKDLTDVLISEGITDQSLLVYDLASQKWINKSILDIFQEINEGFVGATAEANGKAGLVPAPKAGDQDKFLKADGTWASISESLPEDLTSLIETVNTLVGTDTNKSVREIADLVATEKINLVVDGAPEAFDTLKEIATWIENHQDVSDIVEISNKVDNLEDIINGTPAGEDPGTEPAVPGLVQITNDLQDRVEVLETDMTTVKNMLKWQDITE